MRRAAICALLLFTARPALADSDGYYCLGQNYLAFQLGIGGAPGAPYRLYVVRVGGPAAIGPLDSLSLPPFQTEGMICDARAVRILAYNALYTVQLDSATRPARFTVAPLPAGNLPAEFMGRDANLSTLNRAVNEFRVDRVPILHDAAGHTFLLEVSGDPTAVRPCDPDVRARIVENDAAGRQVRERWLPRGLPGATACLAEAPAVEVATPTRPTPPPGGVYIQPATTTHPGEICVDVPPGFVNWSTLAKATLGEKAVMNPGADSLRAHYNDMFQTSDRHYVAPVNPVFGATAWVLIHETGVTPFKFTRYAGQITYGVNRALNVTGIRHSGFACGDGADVRAAFAISLSSPAVWKSEVVSTDSSDAGAYTVTIDGRRYQFDRGQVRTAALRATLIVRGPGGWVLLLVSRSDDSTCGNQYELFAVQGGTLHLLRTNNYNCDV